MALTINNPALEAEIDARARAAGLSAEAYLELLVRDGDAWGELPPDTELEEDTPEEEAEIRAAIAESEEQIERGETRPAEEVFAELRAKYGIPR